MTGASSVPSAPAEPGIVRTLLAMDVSFLVIVLGSLLLLFGLAVVVAVVRVARRWSIEKRSPLARAEARVVDKRTVLTPRGRETQSHFVTFEFPTGERLELEVPGQDSGLLVIGDQGSLAWQGPRYLGFAREVLR